MLAAKRNHKERKLSNNRVVSGQRLWAGLDSRVVQRLCSGLGGGLFARECERLYAVGLHSQATYHPVPDRYLVLWVRWAGNLVEARLCSEGMD